MRKNINWISSVVGFIATSLLLVSIFYLRFKPLHLNPIGDGLDESWKAALAYAAQKGFKFGTDIVFTGGPLSGIYTQTFQEDAPFQLAIYSIMIPIYIGVSLAYILYRSNSPLIICILVVTLAGVCMFLVNDVFLFSIPFLAAVIGASGENGVNRAVSVFGAALAGIVSLAKFSIFPLAILCLIAVDLSALKRRQIPLHLSAMALAFYIAFIGSGQDTSQIIPFILSSLEVSSGYSSAMSIPGSIAELAVFLSLGIALIALMIYAECKGEVPVNVTTTLLITFVFLAFLFIGFKAGFVRHDLHSTIAWNVLTIASMTFCATSRRKSFSLAAILIGALSIFPPQVLVSEKTTQPLFSNVLALTRDADAETGLLKTFMFTPEQWLADRRNAQANARARLGGNSGLQKFQGTMDVVSSNQSLAIAAGANYHPRPTIQEYTTYNSKLISRNRAFYLDEKAPDYVVFAPGSIDGRHPASAEGSLWPLFFSRYEPVDDQPEGLILARRTNPIDNIELESVSVEAIINQDVAVPQSDGPLMMAVHIQPRLFGKIMDILYQPPTTQLTVHYDDGATTSYRLIPEMAEAGFLVSPLVSTKSDYVLVSTGRTDRPTQHHAHSVRVTMGWGHQFAYDEKIRIDFTRLDADKLIAGNKDNKVIDRAIISTAE